MKYEVRQAIRKIHRQIKRPMQQIVQFVGYRLFDKKKSAITQLPALSDIKKILFIRHDGKIGDYIVSSFIYRELKKQAPYLELTVICHTSNAYLFEQNHNIDKIIAIDKRNFSTFARLGKQLSDNHYNIVIDTTSVLRNRDLILLHNLAANITIGCHPVPLKLFDINLADHTKTHISDIYAIILNQLGLKNSDTHYDLPYLAASQQQVNHFITQKKLNSFIAINFWGAASVKQFTLQNSIILIKQVRATFPDQQIMLLTYPAITETVMEILNTFNDSMIFCYTDTRTIFDTVELIKHASLVISPDTAVVHIAAGLNKPLIAFYSNLSHMDDFYRWYPKTAAPCQIVSYRDNINEIDINILPLTCQQSIENYLNH